jgi:hypothetical protein
MTWNSAALHVPVSVTRSSSAHPLQPNHACAYMMSKAKVILLFLSNKLGSIRVYPKLVCPIIYVCVNVCVVLSCCEIGHPPWMYLYPWQINVNSTTTSIP